MCDDDETAVSFLRELIESYPKQKLNADGYSSGEDLLRTGNIYDLIFLDIDMKGIDGIETARRIRIHDRKVKIVYVTSYKEYAGKAFSVHAFGYLLKPVKQEKIWKQIEDALLWQEEEAPEVKQVEFTAVEDVYKRQRQRYKGGAVQQHTSGCHKLRHLCGHRNFRCRWYGTVSYTHLDVYKRQ